MRFEKEINSSKFSSEVQKAHLNILFTAAWVRSRILVLLKPFKITPEQFNILRILRGSKGTPLMVKDITVRMLDGNSNTTRLLEKLEKKELVTKITSETDKRIQLIELSAHGAVLLAKIDVAFEENNPHVSPLEENEASQLNDLLNKLRN